MIPSGFEVCEKQLFNIVKGIHNQEVQHAEIEPFLPRIYEELQDLSKEELIKRFASVEFNRFLSYYRNAPDINIHKGERKGGLKTAPVPGGKMQRLFVNVGEMDGVTKKDFLKLLGRAVGVPPQAVGTIDLKKSFMHFDIDAAFVDRARRELSEFTINGRRVRVDDASVQEGKKGSKEEKIYEKWAKGKPMKSKTAKNW